MNALPKNSINRFIWLILLSGIVLITGCSSIVTNTNSSVQPLASTEHWRARGRFSYSSDDQSQSGNFDWRQEGEDYHLRLYGPLGAGMVRVSGNENLVQIQTKDYDISSDQPLSLLYQMTGLSIPLSSMGHWLVGETASENPSAINRDSENRLTSFQEQAWSLSYADYAELNQQQIPTDITALKDKITLRLLVKTWEPQ